MGEVIDILYGSNLGNVDSEHVYDIASHLLHFEQKFMTWRGSLPANLSLVFDPDALHTRGTDQGNLRYRFILTLRFLNLRILAHRPQLCKYLEHLGNAKLDTQQLLTLAQVGANSVRICLQSALDIVKLMRGAVSPPCFSLHLLGAWWFSLYYSE